MIISCNTIVDRRDHVQYLEITASCSQHGSNYFLLVQNRHTPKGSDVQWMVRRNQHIVAALHLVVSMTEWLLYDLSRYNQVPHLTQDANGKVKNSKLDTTNESQEVSPFPAGDHKAHINRRAQRHSKHKTEKRSTKEVSVKYFTVGLKPVSRRQPHPQPSCWCLPIIYW